MRSSNMCGITAPLILHVTIDTSIHNLRLRRHVDLRPRADRILGLPEARDCLLLRVEVDTRLSIECVRTTSRDRLLVAREAEHGKRHRDRNVDTNLTGFNFLLESSGGRAGRCEDSCAVAVLVLVDEVNCIVEGGHVQAHEYWAKDFFFVAGHVFCDVGDDGWADLGMN